MTEKITNGFENTSTLMKESYEKVKQMPNPDDALLAMRKAYVAYSQLWKDVENGQS